MRLIRTARTAWPPPVQTGRRRASAESLGIDLEVARPADVLDEIRRQVGVQRERLLMLGVLEDALACLERHAAAPGGEDRQTVREARAWVASTDRSEPFALENVCAALGIDAGRLRRSLAPWCHDRGPAVASGNGLHAIRVLRGHPTHEEEAS